MKDIIYIIKVYIAFILAFVFGMIGQKSKLEKLKNWIKYE
jgi:hypothetical protein